MLALGGHRKFLTDSDGDAGDAGLVASAVTLNYPGQTTTAVFDSFSATK